MSLFTSGDNGTFDSTVDPNGNPPSDWNITKAVDSIVKFNNVNPITGTGSMRCESRTIFNDDYALAFTDQGNVSGQGQGFRDDDNVLLYDLNNSFAFEFRHYLDSYDGGNPYLFSCRFGASGGFLRIYWSGANALDLQWIDESGGTNLIRVSDQTFIDNWIHVIVTFEYGTEVRVYVNGTKYTSGTVTPNVSLDTFNEPRYYIALGGNNGRNPTGYGRGVRYYNTFITDAQATDLYNLDPKNIQSVPAALSTNVRREFLLNQEQGRVVNDSGLDDANPSLWTDDISSLGGYTDEEVQFGGGAWVDVTAIV